MKTQIINAKIVTPNEVIENGVLVISDGKIQSINKNPIPNLQTVDANGNYLVAGFIDLHCHGGNGYDFMDATCDQMLEISKFHLSHGTTTLFPYRLRKLWNSRNIFQIFPLIILVFFFRIQNVFLSLPVYSSVSI